MRSIETLTAEGRAPPKRKRRDRFAPELVQFVARAVVGGVGLRPTGIAAKEDLRNVLAVVRAAYRQAGLHGTDRPCDCVVCRAVWTHIVEPKRRRGVPRAF